MSDNKTRGAQILADWLNGDKQRVIRELAATPRFDAVLQVIYVLARLDVEPRATRDRLRREFLDALEEAARQYPGEPLAVSWTGGTQ